MNPKKNIELIFVKNLVNVDKEFHHKRFVLMISGGIDSMVLLYLFIQLYKKYPTISFNIFHLNHKLRGEDADNDAEFVKKYCQANNVEYLIASEDIKKFYKKNKVRSLEHVGREIRYKLVTEYKDKVNADYIVTAHHLDDSIETFFINLLRGSGIDGLSGISLKNGDVIRPLYNIPKQDLIYYANQMEIKFREDYTNTDTYFLRNKIRHHLMPLLEEIRPNYIKNIQKSMNIFGDIENYLLDNIKKEIANMYFKKDGDYIYLNNNELKEYSLSILGYVIRIILNKYYSITTGIFYTHIIEIYKIIHSRTGKGNVVLPFNIVFKRNRNKIFLYKNIC